MKRIILLTSILASVASFAKTTGYVEAYNENETIYADKIKQGNHNFKGIEETKLIFGIKTKVQVENTGFSFGADIRAKADPFQSLGQRIFELKGTKLLENIKEQSSVWAKYELPELNGIVSYIKAEYTPKEVLYFGPQSGGTRYEIRNVMNVEGDIVYKLAEKLKVGLNSKTEFDITGEKFEEDKGLTSDKISSVHKVYLKGEYGKVKDIYAELGVEHDYVPKAKNVFLNAKASYKATKDLTLTGKIDFKHTFNNWKMVDYSLVNIELLENNALKLGGKYRHSYLLSANYTGVKDTEIKLGTFIEHNEERDYKVLNFGFKPEIKYTGIPNLVLSSKNILAGSVIMSDTSGFIKLNANAEYMYKVTNKFTIKPSLDLVSEIDIANGPYPAIYKALALTPKIAAEYKAAENLMISGDISTPIIFNSEKDGINFGYEKTKVKSKLNIKYTW